MHCRHHAVVVALPKTAHALLNLFQAPALRAWNVGIAESKEHARFLTQVDACDVLLVENDCLDANLHSLAWLTRDLTVPVLFVSEAEPLLVQQALALGVHLWLPRSLLLDQPGLLAEALTHLCRAAEIEGPISSPDDANPCEKRREQLADLLWNALPFNGKTGWLSQRYMLERLHEEVVRADRHQTTFSVVLAECALDPNTGRASAQGLAAVDVESALRSWTAERVLRCKRRSDVVGQYGTQGFMLLLPHTPEQGAKVVCRRLRHDLSQGPLGVHSTFGIAGYTSSCHTPKGLLRLAEERLDEEREQPAH